MSTLFDPMPLAESETQVRRSTVKRFWDKVNTSGPIPQCAPHLGACWIFLGGLDPDGYGNFWFERKTIRAHVMARLLTHGSDSIPPGSVVDHLCRNRSCVNPEHTEPVSTAENLRRGIGPSAANSRKTHCKNGHELTGDNLAKYDLSRGKRICRICQIAGKRAWRESHPDAVNRERAQARVRSTARYQRLRDEINANRRADRLTNPEKYNSEREKSRAAYYLRKQKAAQ